MKIKSLVWIAVGLIYPALLVATALAFHQGDLFFFVKVSPRFLYGDETAQLGYDGQFAYFIASDPTNALPHLDVPAYRFQRILYPLLARLLAFGRAEWVPLTLVLINVIAVALGTGAFAELLKREGAPAWTPLLFFAWFGVGQTLLYDLNEIMALTFSLWGLVCFFQKRMLWAGILFGLGALSKDMAFLFAVPVVISLVIARQWREAWRLAALSFTPYVVWLILLRVGLEGWSFDARATQFELIPFAGLNGAGIMTPFVIVFLIVPGLYCTFLALRRLGDVYALATLLSFAFLVFLPRYSYSVDAVFRLSSPLVLAGVLLMARLRRRRILVLCSALWSSSAVLSWLLAVQG